MIPAFEEAVAGMRVGGWVGGWVDVYWWATMGLGPGGTTHVSRGLQPAAALLAVTAVPCPAWPLMASAVALTVAAGH